MNNNITQNPKSSNSLFVGYSLSSSHNITFSPFNNRQLKATFKHNFTLMPNILFGTFEQDTYLPGLMSKLSHSELKVLLCLLRMTLGYKNNQTWFRVSHQKLVELTGVSSKYLWNALNTLESMQLIKRFYKTDEINRYELVIENSILWPALDNPDRRLIGETSKHWTPIPHAFTGGWKHKTIASKVPNVIEQGTMQELKPSELKMVLLILRFTLGYNKLYCKFPDEQTIVNLTGISRRSLFNVKSHIDKLPDKHVYALQYSLLEDTHGSNKTLKWDLGEADVFTYPKKRQMSSANTTGG